MGRHVWTEAEIDVVKARYADTKTETLAQELGVTVDRMYRLAARLGLKKSAAYLASPDACRLRRGDNVGMSGRFKKGLVPWNKGKKGLCCGGKETQFKPGHRGGKAADLYQPIGTVRISKDGYLQRKINDDMPLQKRWRGVHILVWEEANGPLPAGHAVTFKDGNKQNTALDNLQLVTRAELMRRNTVHNRGPEIAQLVRLRGAITRQINRRKKHEQ